MATPEEVSALRDQIKELQQQRQDEAAALRDQIKELEQRQVEESLTELIRNIRKEPRRPSEDSVNALRQLIPDADYKRGTIPDQELRRGPLPPELVSELGARLCWKGRDEAVAAALEGLTEILASKNQLGKVREDTWREACMRLAIIGSPGTGKTELSQQLVSLAAAKAAANGQQDMATLLQSCIHEKLQFSMNLAEAGCQRLRQEQGEGNEQPPMIKPAQSLSLRFLYLLCRNGDETFQDFVDDRFITSKYKNNVAEVLAKLEVRHVITAARQAFQLGEEQHTWHFIFDECQFGCEVSSEDQAKPGSNAQWLKSMISAQAKNLAQSGDFVVLTVAGTQMDFINPAKMTASADSVAHLIPVRLLTDEEMLEIAEDLCTRLGCLQLSKDLPLLISYAGGNPRHLEAVLAAAAKAALPQRGSKFRLDVPTQALKKALESWESKNFNPVLHKAFHMISKRLPEENSLQKWVTFGDGAIVRRLLGYILTGKPVRRSDLLCVVESGNEVKLGFGFLEGTGVLALQLCPGGDTYTAVVPPIIFYNWYNYAKVADWLPDVELPMLENLSNYISSQQKEVMDGGMIMMKIYAYRFLLERPTCKLRELLPLLKSCHKDVRDLVIQLPSDPNTYDLSIVRGKEDLPTFEQEIARAEQGGRWAYLGPGNEKAPDWNLFLKTADNKMLVLQGQSKSHQYSNSGESQRVVLAEYQKRHVVSGGKRSLFVFMTDGKVVKHDIQGDIVIIDGEQLDFYCPYGKMRRKTLRAAADARPQQ